MKGLEDFFSDIKINENLSLAFEQTTSLQKMVELAKKHGYNFSKEELTKFYLDSVSGGLLDIDATSQTATITQTIVGDGNLQFNSGSVTAAGGDAESGTSGKNEVDPMAVLTLIFGRK